MAIFPTHVWPTSFVGRLLVARPRLFVSVAVAIIGFLALGPASFQPVTRLLAAWNIGTWLYIALYLVMIVTSDDKVIRWRAKITDEGQFVILLLTSLAAVASLAAIFAELSITKDLKGLEKELHLALVRDHRHQRLGVHSPDFRAALRSPVLRRNQGAGRRNP